MFSLRLGFAISTPSFSTFKLKQMGRKGKVLSIFLLVIASATSANNPQFLTSVEGFGHELFNNLVASNGDANIIYSPLAVGATLTMARMGADGQTADEMDEVLGFNEQTTDNVADNYHSILDNVLNIDILKTAHRIYVKEDLELRANYTQLLSGKFLTSPEAIDFSQPEEAAGTINAWVESQTNHKVQDLVSANSLGDNARSVLVSAMDFKGKWVAAFEKENTKARDFYTNDNKAIKITMMQRPCNCDAELIAELKANVLRLPYKDSDFSMLIFLPTERSGLKNVVKRLKHFQLKSLRRKLKNQYTSVFLPKFKAEFQTNLNSALNKMGLNLMFGKADFGKMLESSDDLSVSQVIHKAVIEVNEEGDADESINSYNAFDTPLVFNANYPFAYAIVNKNFVPLALGTYVGV